jgi:hypothetical protein
MQGDKGEVTMQRICYSVDESGEITKERVPTEHGNRQSVFAPSGTTTVQPA